MTDKPNDGGPAFPRYTHTDDGIIVEQGMSKRDWFAGMALQGVLAAGTAENISCDKKIQEISGGPSQAVDLAMFAICGMAFEYADAMIAESEK